MKKVLMLFTLTLLLATSCRETKKQTEQTKDTVVTTIEPLQDTTSMQDVILGFAAAYNTQDTAKTNAYIHPELGLYIIYTPGVADVYQKVKGLDFKKPVPEHFPYSKAKNEYNLRYESLPEFDCGKDRWTKLGFFCDSTATPDQLSQILDFKRDYENIPKTEVEQIKMIEKDSYRVILTKNDNLIFHVKRYKGAWYVTVLDRAYGWCDA